MKVVGVIPARLASTRLEAKVLMEIASKPMIQHVWQRVKKSSLLDDVIIACDDQKIFDCAVKFGANVKMTSVNHNSGTDRIAEVVKDLDVDIVVNIQGDEPLINSKVIDDLVLAIKNDPDCLMATVIKVTESSDEIHSPNVVKVVRDQNDNALYFSRYPIPFNRSGNKDVIYFKHLGIYVYRKEFLLKFSKMHKSRLEDAEKLEQLRVLEAGYKIKTIITDMDSVGVDTKEDLAKVEALIRDLQ